MAETKRDDEKELKDLKEKMKKCLDNLILEKFPKKVIELNELIDKTFTIKTVSSMKTDINIPIPDKPNGGQTSTSATVDRTGLDKRVFLFPNGLNAINKDMSKLMARVKPLVLDFVSDMRSLKFAIQLMVPKVEDGNNFGVDIQKSVIKAIGRAERQSLRRMRQFSVYHSSRGNTVASIARYPHCDDYRQCVREDDQKFYLILCLMVRELRDDYVALNDVIVKNLDKIKNPKPIRDSNMY